MVNWIKCTDRMPDNDNPVANECFVRTIWDTYFQAYWSTQLNVWRRIETPINEPLKTGLIDEIVKPEIITHWVYLDEVKVND